MSKTIWMITGNKGGVGKSLFSTVLASFLEIRGEDYAVLDGDGRVGDVYEIFLRKCPAKLADFRELRPESRSCRQDEVYENMVYQLLSTSDNLIINTPDGADYLLMKWFDMTLGHTEANNWQFKFMYLLSDRPDGLNLLPDLIKRFSFFYPIRNLYFGEEQLFTTFNYEYRHLFREIINMPRLRAEEARMLFDIKSYPYEAIYLKNSNDMFTLPALSRARLEQWQSNLQHTMNEIFDKNEPNLKA